VSKGTDLDRIVTSVPLNKTVARVMGRGVHYEPEHKPAATYVQSEDPLPVKDGAPFRGVNTYDALIGKQFGRWRVIGLADPQPKSRVAVWVVKCSCGRYNHRRAKQIKRAAETGDCCHECQNLARIRHNYKKHGSRPLDAFTAHKPEQAADVAELPEPSAARHE
jgi:hypothetical protein